MKDGKKMLLSGVKPTGAPHIGNYFGAIKQFVDLQYEYDEVFIFIADYHALNLIKNSEELRENILNLAIDYLSAGLDASKVVFYQQSQIKEHTELTWIFNTITSMPFLERAHVYKDALAKGREISVGDFDYPVLMAADILLYDTDVVPVGKDQKQHIEITRDIAEKFNKIYGSTFKLPNPLILEEAEAVPGIDGRKMSKSYNNTIPLFASREEINKAVMSIITDSEGERPENVYAIHKLFKDEDSLRKLYEENKGKYKNLKEALAEDIDSFIKPLREKRKEYQENLGFIIEILQNGAELARQRAENKMKTVYDNIGINLY